jgi:signal peptidase II
MKKYLPILLISPLVILADQLTKLWVISRVPLGGETPVFPGYFEIVHRQNPGAAFSLLADWDSQFRNGFFFVVSLVAMVILFVLYAKTGERERRVQVPLALILGGAVGNLLDRLYQGVVTDFLLFHWRNEIADFAFLGKNFRFALSWPAFNIADSAITCGAIFLVIQILFFAKKK